MNAALTVESLKLRRSPVGLVASCALFGGTIALLVGITAGISAGHEEIIAQAGPAASLDWNGLLAGAAQIFSAAGLIGFGVVLSWMFAREFTDGTITGLFGLPVSRHRIALAKLTVYAAWVVLLSLVVTGGLLLLGLVMGYGMPSAETWLALGRQWVLGVFSGALAVPVAWVATVTRSLLAAVGAVIGLVVIAQVGAFTGAGAWNPIAAPTLWALSGGVDVTALQLAVTVLFSAIFLGLTCFSWARLQLHR